GFDACLCGNRGVIAGSSRFRDYRFTVIPIWIAEHRHEVDRLPTQDVDRYLELALVLFPTESIELRMGTRMRSERDAMIRHLARFIPVQEASIGGNTYTRIPGERL